ncbi:MAG TPA: alpha/beta fold hydrolase [Thermoanaerobaculia bacterium]|nr:alpha/beta fold hydrolase [Thermoanaerobaculia bacterium]
MHFEIASTEGLPIRGNLDVPERPRALVVVIHGFKGFKDWGFFPWLAQRLTGHRFAVCRFNMSRGGIGDDPESFDRLDLFADDTYSQQLDDLRTVVAFAQSELPQLPVVLLGHSRGGGIAILGAAAVPRLRGVVAWSPISSVDRWDEAMKREWRERGFLDNVNTRTKQNMRMSTRILDDYDAHASRLNVLAAAAALPMPLFVVHGGRDESVSPDEGRLLAARAPEASIAILHRASHTYNAIHPLIHVPFELELAAELSARFIEAHTRVAG